MILRNHVGGRWTDAPRHGPFFDPADAREPIGDAPRSGPAEVDAAVEAARAAFPAWSAWPAPRRGAVLSRIAAGIAAESETLAAALTRNQGKTIAEARSEVRRAAEAFDFCAGETRRIAGETLPSEVPGRLTLTLREPLGAVGVVTPSNYPALISAWKIAPALAAGNTVVWAPSARTPLVHQRLTERIAAALEEEGAPAGTVNRVEGEGAEVGAALATHPRVAAISFTGSATNGAAVRAATVARGIPTLCEMGGKNPLVVLDDADVEFAAEACSKGAFGNAGQRCTSTSRVIVVSAVERRFTEALVERARRLRIGPGADPASEMGPLVSGAARESLEAELAKAAGEGVDRLCGGGRPPDPSTRHGYFVEPTVLRASNPAARIAQEELFGPVVVLLRASGDDDALRLANGIRYGLSASVYTRDLDRALRFSRGIEAGIVHVNSATVGGETHVPFAGWKATSTGGPERGRAAVDFFTRWKTLYVDSR